MADSGHFNPPFDRAAWIWMAGAAIVAVALTYWATSGSERRQVTAENVPTINEPFLLPPMPPITQPGPARPADADEL